jgi:hypothetical protein
MHACRQAGRQAGRQASRQADINERLILLFYHYRQKVVSIISFKPFFQHLDSLFDVDLPTHYVYYNYCH